MKKLFATMGVAAAVLALPTVSAAQSHHGGGGGGYRGGGGAASSGSGSGGGYREQGSARSSGGGYRGGGGSGYRGGYGRGYGYGGYRGYGFYPYFGFGFSSAFFDPWYGGYPFYSGAPWYYDYGSGGPYPPPGDIDDSYGYPGSAGRDRYPSERDDRGGAWERDYGSSSDEDARAPREACGQWVWNTPAGKYDWQPGACAPAGAAPQPRAVDAPPLRVPPTGERG